MASFRNHRIVIASLFLPTTAVLGESPPVTPENDDDVGPSASGPETTILAVAQRLATEQTGTAKGLLNTHSRSHSMNIPLKSIVEDLRDKVRPSVEFMETFFLVIFMTEPLSYTLDAFSDCRDRKSIYQTHKVCCRS